MLEFHIEILTNLIAGITLSIATIVCITQGIRMKNRALSLLGLVSLLFGIMIFLQAFSYMIISESLQLAMILKQISVVLVTFSYVVMYIFVNYVWFERMRIILLIPVIVLAVLEITAIYFTEGLVVYTFYEEGFLIATTIGKAGFLLFFETVLGNGFMNIIIMAYFIKSYLKAPMALKRSLRNILLYVLGSVVAGIVVTVMNRFLTSGTLKLLMFGIAYLLVASAYVVIIALTIRNPKLLFVLPFRVDRLLIIDNKSGLPLFDFQFSKQKIDDILFSGLIQGLQQMSVEVLQKGEIKQINLESGVLIFRKMKFFTVGLLASRSSQILGQSFNTFTDAFENKFGILVKGFMGERSIFQDANTLIYKHFGYVPIDL